MSPQNSKYLLSESRLYRRPPAEKSRLSEAVRKLLSNTLQRGELFRLVTGAAPISPELRHQGTLVRARCKSCNLPLMHAGEPLRSQPARCLVCGKAKRHEHNQAARVRLEELIGQRNLDPGIGLAAD